MAVERVMNKLKNGTRYQINIEELKIKHIAVLGIELKSSQLPYFIQSQLLLSLTYF
jgi:hypothetical protein